MFTEKEIIRTIGKLDELRIELEVANKYPDLHRPPFEVVKDIRLFNNKLTDLLQYEPELPMHDV